MNGRDDISLLAPGPRRAALAAGAAGVALCVAGLVVNRPQVFQSWLFAHQFFLALALGGLALLMVHHLMGGQWGYLIARMLEAMAQTLPLLALLFVPIFFGMRTLYPWARPEDVAASPLLQLKTAYLNVPSFIVRAAVYFTIWIVLAWLFRRWSLARDRAPDPALSLRMLRAGALGLVLYFPTMTFAAVDWMMSLEPEWYSTMYGVVVIVGQGLQALALALLVLYGLARERRIAPLLTNKALNDLGNMVLAFVVFWTYVSFMQYLVIWMGDLREEIPWVLHRSRGGWQWVSAGLLLVNFFLPFLALLFRAVKRRPGWLALIGALLLVMRVIGHHWLIAPEFHPRLSVHWLDLAALVAVGGLWSAVFLRALAGVPRVALNDPRRHPEETLEEAYAHE